VGDRGAPGTPHLHFTAFTGDGIGARQNRRSLPLTFADGYDLKDLGGCNQYGGATLTAVGKPRPWQVAGKTFLPLVAPAMDVPQLPRTPKRWSTFVCDAPAPIRFQVRLC
jgi:hypothetical protein